MRIPKDILKLIKDIEETGQTLKTLESELYSWLEAKGFDTADDEPNKDGYYLDMCLEFLFHHHDGEDLIKFLKSSK